MVDSYEQLYRRLAGETADFARQPGREGAMALSA